MTTTENSSDPSLFASGGGDATAGGVTFEAVVGAIFASQLLAEQPLDARLDLGGAKPRWLRFETEAPVDDILVGTDTGGTIAIQVKSTLTQSTSAESEYGKTAAQMVRYWIACIEGSGKRDWARPLDVTKDRILLAVGARSSSTIRIELASALNRYAAGPHGVELSQGASEALNNLRRALEMAWSGTTKNPLVPGAIDSLLQMTRVITYDADGSDVTSASQMLAPALDNPSMRVSAFQVLSQICQRQMSSRGGGDAAIFRRFLEDAGVSVAAPVSYQADIAALKAYTLTTQAQLGGYEKIDVAAGPRTFTRECSTSILRAALEGSFLLVGEPGAGKSAVINSLTRTLIDTGNDVLQLAVDRLPVQGIDGLSAELGLHQHPLLDVLRNWDGNRSAYLIIDALDASRGGQSEAVFRALITEILSWKDSRWRVIASIRTFDLRFGQHFKTLFKGIPPEPTLADPSLGRVKHIQVPEWTDAEFAEVLRAAPELDAAIAAGGQRLRHLAKVPFNTRILAELTSSGAQAQQFANLTSQIELLQMYWAVRVAPIGTAGELCLRNAVALMVQARELRADRLGVAERHSNAFDALQLAGVLVLTDPHHVGFRHHLLFDYAASRVYLKPHEFSSDPGAFSKEGAVGLILGPALAFALRELWISSASRDSFWQAVSALAGTVTVDPIARSIASRAAAELPQTPSDTAAFGSLITEKRYEADKALAHVSGALAVRLEDKEQFALSPWAALVSSIADHLEGIAWICRGLLFLLVDRIDSDTDKPMIGKAARALLQYSYANNEPQLTESAISLVADTFLTDPIASRQLLSKIFEGGASDISLAKNAPALAIKVRKIADADPDFVVHVYNEIYKKEVTDRSSTPLGDSRILSLRTNPKQDFEMARYALSESFKAFLAAHPVHAADALIAVIEGFVARRHPIAPPATEQTLDADGRRFRLLEDWSYLWASDPAGRYSDDGDKLLVVLLSHIASAPIDNALAILTELTQKSRLAVIWARCFLAAARRPGDLADLMWPYAKHEAFL